MKEYIVKVLDKEGKEWVYDGNVKGNPIFIPSDRGMGMGLSQAEAHDVWLNNCMKGETIILERIN